MSDPLSWPLHGPAILAVAPIPIVWDSPPYGNATQWERGPAFSSRSPPWPSTRATRRTERTSARADGRSFGRRRSKVAES